METAVAYMRCSGPAQLHGDTWERQIETIQACATAKGFQLRQFRELAVPGKAESEDRPAWVEMLVWMKANKCKIVIVERLDRLSRLYRRQEELIADLADLGYTLIAADTGEDITEAMMGDPMRRFCVQVQGLVAELVKNVDVMKMRKAMERIRQEGRKPGQKNYSPDPVLNHRCEGRLPYGAKPGEAETLDKIICAKKGGLRPDAIANMLNDRGIPTRYNKQWHAATVSKILARQETRQ